MNKKKKVAIFDIDGTIFRSSLLIEVTEALIREGIFPKSIIGIYRRAKKNWLQRQGSYEDYIGAVVRAFDQNLKKIAYTDFKQISKEVIRAHKDKVYVYTRDLIKELKSKDYYILAISHSPKEILDAFCKNYGFDKVYGRIYQIDKRGIFTGKTLHLELINNKAEVLARAVEKEGLTLQDSVGVGDTESDITFLTKVSNPICFNPNKKLYEHAKKHGWKIVVERKDVVYKI